MALYLETRVNGQPMIWQIINLAIQTQDCTYENMQRAWAEIY